MSWVDLKDTSFTCYNGVITYCGEFSYECLVSFNNDTKRLAAHITQPIYPTKKSRKKKKRKIKR